MATIVPQLDICLKLKSIRGGGGERDCTLFKITPRNAIRFGNVSSCGTLENHLMLFKERHLLYKDRGDGIFSPQSRRRASDDVLISSGYKILELIVIFQV